VFVAQIGHGSDQELFDADLDHGGQDGGDDLDHKGDPGRDLHVVSQLQILDECQPDE
jgi:hypothetical protein